MPPDIALLPLKDHRSPEKIASPLAEPYTEPNLDSKLQLAENWSGRVRESSIPLEISILIVAVVIRASWLLARATGISPLDKNRTLVLPPWDEFESLSCPLEITGPEASTGVVRAIHWSSVVL